eukprot:TRINITY_DN673_c0_g1_i3.p2 TRINITY_DN673_c0_g1~~TRINITY_DN673_c0_g1_i3.p2  ORF type:complete len:259 (+),score=87.90 TRINITY_DN673_c0_g1_i3:1019-1795(+)
MEGAETTSENNSEIIPTQVSKPNDSTNTGNEKVENESSQKPCNTLPIPKAKDDSSVVSKSSVNQVVINETQLADEKPKTSELLPTTIPQPVQETTKENEEMHPLGKEKLIQDQDQELSEISKTSDSSKLLEKNDNNQGLQDKAGDSLLPQAEKNTEKQNEESNPKSEETKEPEKSDKSANVAIPQKKSKGKKTTIISLNNPRKVGFIKAPVIATTATATTATTMAPAKPLPKSLAAALAANVARKRQRDLQQLLHFVK